MHDRLLKDEHEWEQEHADIPTLDNQPSASVSIVSQQSMPKVREKLTNMTDFSGILCTDSSYCTDMSINRFFSNRCLDLHEILPNKSPTKHVPISLIPNSSG